MVVLFNWYIVTFIYDTVNGTYSIKYMLHGNTCITYMVPYTLNMV